MLYAIALVAAVAVAGQAEQSAPPPEDPVVCKSSKEHNVGTRVKRAPVCKPKSEWALESRTAQRELQQMKDRWKDPGRADAGR